MIGRPLWFLAGAGAGAYAVVRARRVAEALTPDGLRDRLGAAALGARRFAEEVAAGSAEKETELRERLSLAPPGSQPPPALAQPSPDRPDQRVIPDAVQ